MHVSICKNIISIIGQNMLFSVHIIFENLWNIEDPSRCRSQDISRQKKGWSYYLQISFKIYACLNMHKYNFSYWPDTCFSAWVLFLRIYELYKTPADVGNKTSPDKRTGGPITYKFLTRSIHILHVQNAFSVIEQHMLFSIYKISENFFT